MKNAEYNNLKIDAYSNSIDYQYHNIIGDRITFEWREKTWKEDLLKLFPDEKEAIWK